MTKKILIHGDAFTPPRFYHYKYCGILSQEEIQSLKNQHWYEHDLTPTEEDRLLRVGSFGCCGDLLDKFYTMYGKECVNDK